MIDAQSVFNDPAIACTKILCVDDEPNILSSLRRLLRGQGYQIFLAEGCRPDWI
jgi:response regulator RpfG family c-di-GMP phosphodiesterase